MERLLAGPTNARPQAPAEESCQLSDYSAFFADPAARGAAAGRGAMGRGRARPVLPPEPARLRAFRASPASAAAMSRC